MDAPHLIYGSGEIYWMTGVIAVALAYAVIAYLWSDGTEGDKKK